MSAKRFVPLSESVLALAARLAERSGTPVREFIEKVLEEVLKAMQFRSNVVEVISLSDMLDDLRRLGGIILPRNVTYQLIESVSEDEYAALERELRRIALWYGTLVKVKKENPIDALRLVLNTWLPEMHVNIVRGADGSIKLVASSNEQPMRITLLARAVIEELCRALDLHVSNVVTEKGIVKVEILTQNLTRLNPKQGE